MALLPTITSLAPLCAANPTTLTSTTTPPTFATTVATLTTLTAHAAGPSLPLSPPGVGVSSADEIQAAITYMSQFQGLSPCGFCFATSYTDEVLGGWVPAPPPGGFERVLAVSQ
eukprot:2212672-Prymnesium_polylepis.1